MARYLTRALSLALLSFVPLGAEPVTPSKSLPRLVGRNATVPAADFYNLGVKWGLGISHINRANRTGKSSDPLVLPLGRILPDRTPVNGVVVNLAEQMLYVFRDGKFDKFFPVAIGSGGRFATPTGDCKIVEKVKHPQWLPPSWAGMGEGAVVEAGPDNPLGERWIGLSMPGLGFHGTTQPTSIGTAASHGCMRMYSVSVKDLFERVEIGWPVRLEYETARVGQAKDGTISMVAFADVYGLKPPTTELARLVSSYGLSDWVSPERVLQVGGSATGLAVPVLEGGLRLVYGGGVAAENFRPNLLKTPQGLLVSSEALGRLGCTVEFDKASRLLLVQRAVKVRRPANSTPLSQPTPQPSPQPAPSASPDTSTNTSLTPDLTQDPVPLSTPLPVDPAPEPELSLQVFRVQAAFQSDALGSYAGESMLRAYSIAGQSFVSVREALPLLDFTYQFDPKGKTLSVYPKTKTSK